VGDCVQGTECDGTQGSQTCTAITYGGAGASCGSSSKRCNTGTYCDFSAMQCAQQKAAGAACMSTQECAKGLLCDPASMTCGKETFVQAGQPCGGGVTCEVGSCPMTGVCPTIIADGKPCDTSNKAETCDVFSSCDQGVCKFFLADTCM